MFPATFPNECARFHCLIFHREAEGDDVTGASDGIGYSMVLIDTGVLVVVIVGLIVVMIEMIILAVVGVM